MDRITMIESRIQAARAELTAMLTKATAESRPMTDEESVRATATTARLDTLENELKAERKQLEYDRTEAVPIATADRDPEGLPSPTRREGDKLSYAALFGQPKANAHFRGGEEFFAAIASGRYHPGLIQASMLEGLGSTGGFLVPEQLSAEMFDAAIEQAVFLPRCRTYSMLSDERQVAGFVADGSTTYGGFGWGASWVAEGGSITESNPTLRKVNIKAYKAGIYVTVSSELLADGLSFGEQLGNALRKALAFAVDDSILRGNGVGKPLGILASPALVTVDKENGQTAATIVSNNVLKMHSRMLPGSHARAVWFVAPSALPQLYTMNILAGVGGQAAGDIQGYFNASAMTLFGRPVVVTEKCSALGTVGDILFADCSLYAVGLRKEVELAQSNAPGFQTDMMAYRAIARVGGLPLLSEAYQPKNGTDKLSPFVTLQTRA